MNRLERDATENLQFFNNSFFLRECFNAFVEDLLSKSEPKEKRRGEDMQSKVYRKMQTFLKVEYLYTLTCS